MRKNQKEDIIEINDENNDDDEIPKKRQILTKSRNNNINKRIKRRRNDEIEYNDDEDDEDYSMMNKLLSEIMMKEEKKKKKTIQSIKQSLLQQFNKECEVIMKNVNMKAEKYIFIYLCNSLNCFEEQYEEVMKNMENVMNEVNEIKNRFKKELKLKMKEVSAIANNCEIISTTYKNELNEFNELKISSNEQVKKLSENYQKQYINKTKQIKTKKAKFEKLYSLLEMTLKNNSDDEEEVEEYITV